MNKDRNEMAEMILDLTLEIVYLLTGEVHMFVKKPGEHPNHSSCVPASEELNKTPSPSTQNADVVRLPHLLIHERKNDKKILELTNKIIHLLTGEVPIRCEDVTVYFSMEEWEYLEGHKDLYKELMMETHQTLISQEDKSTSGGLRTSVFFPDFETNESGHEISKYGKISKTKKRQTGSIECVSRESQLYLEENCPDVDIDTPTGCLQKAYVSTRTDQESASCKEGHHTNSDNNTSSQNPQSICPPNHIKEEPTSCEAITATKVSTPIGNKQIEENHIDDDIYTPTEHTQTEYASTHIKEESAVCEVIVTEDHNNILSEVIQTEDECGYNEDNLNSPETNKTLLNECTKLDKNIDPKSSIYPKNKEAICYWSEHPKVSYGNSEHVLHSSALTRNEVAASEMDNVFFYTSAHVNPVPNSTQEKPFSCSECGKFFSVKRSLTKHQSIHIGLKPFKCNDCGKCFRVKYNLTVHTRIHTKEKPFECSDCKKCFRLKHSLTVHRRTHTGEKPFVCSDCWKCFGRKDELVKHQRIHRSEKPFKCNECGSCFRVKHSLTVHQRIHTEEKPFECTDCGRCFRLKPSLTVHQRIHTGEKPFVCGECWKCFRRRNELIKHQRIHRSEKPYKCTECGKCFSQKGNLASHKSIHTGEKPFKCSECGKCCRLKYDLIKHQRIHKTEKPV
ncbi:zinc finger protein ZFP2-like [Pelobates fuscus]|uniref:zinc finger protein ZFP2-like n=1 Tax=Pelobates fuscus TaxID=191477 RepID=UPI002FE45FD1